MASNFKTVINFRDGIQVDTNDIVSTDGKVGIGSTLPRDTLDVRGDTIIEGSVSATSINVTGVSTVADFGVTNLNVSGVGTINKLKVDSGIVTATSGVVTYYGDGGSLLNLPTSQWVDTDVGLGFTSIYAQGNVGVGTTNPIATFQVGQQIYADGVAGVITAISFSGTFSGTASTATNASVAYGLTATPDITVDSIVGASASITGFVTATTSLSVGSSFQADSGGFVTATKFFGDIDGLASQAVVAAGTTDDPNIIVTSIASSSSSLKPFHLKSAGISTFEGNLTVFDAIGINTISPGSGLRLDIYGDSRVRGNTNTDSLDCGGSFTISTSGEVSGGNLNFTTGIHTVSNLDTEELEVVTSIKIGSTDDAVQALDIVGNAIISNQLGIGTTSPGAFIDVAEGGIMLRNNAFIGTYLGYDATNTTSNHIFNDTLFPPPGGGTGEDSASVGIGTTNANGGLDMQYAKKPLILPHFSTAERNAIASPIAGMIIYNTSTNTVQFHNGTSWGNI